MYWLELFNTSPTLFYIFVAITGLCLGSFLNVVIYRLPIMLESTWRHECETFLNAVEDVKKTEQQPFNLILPRSSCPHCGHTINALENIPLLSYLVLRGKCRQCHHAISARYPIVELFTAALSILVAMKFGVSWQTVAALVFTWCLIGLSFIDLDTQLLPDNITLPLLWLGLLLSLNHTFVSPEEAIIGAAVGFMSLWTLYWAFKLLTGKEGMGYGDFKLLAVIGAWIGWQALPLVILLSSFVGALVGISLIIFKGHDKNNPIPFGPYLAIAGWLCFVWGDTIMTNYYKAIF